MSKPWTVNAQPNRCYPHQFHNQGTGGPAGMDLQPKLNRMVCRKCTKPVPSNKAKCPNCGGGE